MSLYNFSLRYQIVALIIIAKSLWLLGNNDFRFNTFRRLAKSTLILIPLFGVHYIIFVFAQFNQVNETLELVRLYVDIFFISFQVRDNIALSIQ